MVVNPHQPHQQVRGVRQKTPTMKGIAQRRPEIVKTRMSKKEERQKGVLKTTMAKMTQMKGDGRKRS